MNDAERLDLRHQQRLDQYQAYRLDIWHRSRALYVQLTLDGWSESQAWTMIRGWEQDIIQVAQAKFLAAELDDVSAGEEP